MANHLHRQIREAVATKVTGLTTTGARVFPNRMHPFDATALPGLRVFIDRDDVNVDGAAFPHIQQHKLMLVIEALATATADLDDTLDLISKEVETVLSAGFLIGSRTLQCALAGSRHDFDAAATPAGVKRMFFQIEYHTTASAPDSLL